MTLFYIVIFVTLDQNGIIRALILEGFEEPLSLFNRVFDRSDQEKLIRLIKNILIEYLLKNIICISHAVLSTRE